MLLGLDPAPVAPRHRHRLPVGRLAVDPVPRTAPAQLGLHGEGLALDAQGHAALESGRPGGRLGRLAGVVDVDHFKLGAVAEAAAV